MQITIPFPGYRCQGRTPPPSAPVEPVHPSRAPVVGSAQPRRPTWGWVGRSGPGVVRGSKAEAGVSPPASRPPGGNATPSRPARRQPVRGNRGCVAALFAIAAPLEAASLRDRWGNDDSPALAAARPGSQTTPEREARARLHQYSSASMMVSTRTVTFGSAGFGEPPCSPRS